MNILHVADYVMPEMGYQEFILPKWNAKHGHEVHIITSDRYTPVPDYENTWQHILGPRHIGESTETIENVLIHRLPVKLEFKRRIWLSGLFMKIKQINPDIIFCHGTSSPLAFALVNISKKLRIPLIMDNHMAFVAQRSGILARMYYFALKLLTKIYLNKNVSSFLGMSDESCEFMITQQGINPAKVGKLDFGVDTDIFGDDLKSSPRTRTYYGIPDDATIIMQTGKLSQEKGTDILTEAMLPLMIDDPSLWLIFVGGGNSAFIKQCMEPFQLSSVSNRVLTISFVPITQLPSLMKMSDICVYPGESSLSCIEASACSTPVIITDLPWGKARSKLGIGTCYETGNVKDLRSHLQRLIESKELRTELGEVAREKVLELYSYDLVAKNVEFLMEDAINQYGQQ